MLEQPPGVFCGADFRADTNGGRCTYFPPLPPVGASLTDGHPTPTYPHVARDEGGAARRTNDGSTADDMAMVR